MKQSFFPKLISTALITSPLMGLFSFTQMYVIIQVFSAINPGAVSLPEFNTGRMIGAMAGILLVSLMFWVINICLVYWEKRLNWNIHRGWRYIFSFILVMGLGAIIQVFIAKHRPIQTPYSFLIPFLGIFVINSFILVLIDLIIARDKKAQLELDKAYLEVSNLVASQKHLRSQIHPHFLFNALATLQILITSSPSQAKQYLQRLSNFLRSSISKAENDIVSIEEELALFTDYIELQRVRFQDSISYSVDIPDAIQRQGYLPIFTLQMLAENAIQHNGFNEDEGLEIVIRYNTDNTISVFNNLIPKYAAEPSTGTGLQNLSKRFELLGAKSPIITREENTQHFLVTVDVLNKDASKIWM